MEINEILDVAGDQAFDAALRELQRVRQKNAYSGGGKCALRIYAESSIHMTTAVPRSRELGSEGPL